MPPPLCLTTPNTVASPRPVPSPPCLVVKNGSNRCARTLLVHADAGVGHGEQHVRTGELVRAVRLELDIARLERERAAVRHRVAGVGGEVEDHALDLRAVGLDGREVRREPRRHAHVVADDAVQHRLHPGDDLVQVQHLRVQHLAPAEGQQLAREARRLARGAGDLLQLLAAVAGEQDLGVAGDHGQEVVEVVRDAAGEPPDRLHLLRVREPALEPLALAHVVRHDEHGVVALEVDPPGGDLDVDLRAVAAADGATPWPRATRRRRGC